MQTENNVGGKDTPLKSGQATPETSDSDITPEERELLDSSFEDQEEHDLHDVELDDTDNEGEPLNEQSSASSRSGGDLDVPGSEDDDANEDIGEEDEENNSYSESDTQ
jgi:hypothetical protein